ncbi:MAG: molybdopterin-guanine dinucleotide biosynthesis protein B [Anaerolineales bacterium]|nr:molybdopterin-guanine dinucleotide biosynthesis protein B [Anaerolineales bacterium]
MPTPILSIVGRSKVGKTTLLEILIPALKQRGLRIATIKHHAHPGFEIDQPGKDTWRHAQAGSDCVVLSAPDKIATIRRLQREQTLDEIAANISDVDLILTEGYKRAGKPTLEVVRQEKGLELLSSSGQLLAVASDVPLSLNVPVFPLDDAAGMAEFILQHFFPDKDLKS